MRDFSIIKGSQFSATEQYTNYLKYEVYGKSSMDLNKYINDPIFLQQLSIVQANDIRNAIQTNGAVLYEYALKTDETMQMSAKKMSERISSFSLDLTSSLNNGFLTLNNSICLMDSSIRRVGNMLDITNNEIQSLAANVSNGFNVVQRNFETVNKNLAYLNQSVGVANDNLRSISVALSQGMNTLVNELRIPESQRERRYHTENGLRYFTAALKNGDESFFNDAYDEFNKCLEIEKKDYFSWYYIAFICSHSPKHFNINKAFEAYDKFFHYASVHSENNYKVCRMIEEAHFNKAELLYISGKALEAVWELDDCNDKEIMAKYCKAKYLSSTEDETKMAKAADIMYDLLFYNPYMSMRILEDYDLLNNTFVEKAIQTLKSNFRQTALSELQTLLSYKPKMVALVKPVLNDVDNLLSKDTFLDTYEAFCKLRMPVPITSSKLECTLEYELRLLPIIDKECELVHRYGNSRAKKMLLQRSAGNSEIDRFQSRIDALCNLEIDLSNGDFPMVLECLYLIEFELLVNKNNKCVAKCWVTITKFVEEIKSQKQSISSDYNAEIDEVINKINKLMSSL